MRPFIAFVGCLNAFLLPDHKNVCIFSNNCLNDVLSQNRRTKFKPNSKKNIICIAPFSRGPEELSSRPAIRWVAGPKSWVAGLIRWVASPISWVAGLIRWVAGPISWVAGPISWVAGPISWVAGLIGWVAGPISWVTQMVKRVTKRVRGLLDHQNLFFYGVSDPRTIRKFIFYWTSALI